MAVIDNVHERVLPVPAARVGDLLDRLGAAGDPLWPAPTWMPMRFDRPLGVGADGGHGPIRYRVTAYEPGRRVEFTFHPRIGLRGTHTAEVHERDQHSCVLRHQLTAVSTGRMRLLWWAIVRTCHDTVVEHLLDNAERAVTGGLAQRPVRYPVRARLAVAAESVRLRPVGVPEEAFLLHAALPRPDLAHAVAVRVPPGTSTDPQHWADAVFRDRPPVVTALLRLRDALVVPLGIERGGPDAFDTAARTDHEVLLGADARHLDFRADVLVRPDDDGTTVTLSTHATVRSRRGRAYLGVVRLFHPMVVRAMLRRAARKAVAPPRTRTVEAAPVGTRA